MLKARESQPLDIVERVDVKALFWAGGLIVALMIALSIASLQLKGVEGHYMVIAPPWATQMQSLALLAGSDAQMVSAGGLQNIIIVASDQADFVEKTKRAGAWAVWPAPKILGCGGEFISKANG